MEDVFFIVPLILILNLQTTLSSNDAKRTQSKHSIETDRYRRNKDQLNEKEGIKCTNMKNGYKCD